ncbi:MAG: hypothetical protein QOD72_3137, partial [Acidimicrobiaceae bacterium]|nr:hypothetical protein [Acidimicrobiaceae bacterium]
MTPSKRQLTAQNTLPEGVTVRAGPTKSGSTSIPLPRLSHHKARASWFRARSAWPQREAPSIKLASERTRAAKMIPSAKRVAQWEQAGPTNIGGRCTTVVAHPTNADQVWIGSAG